MTFTGRPKPAYYAVQRANRQVLPILFSNYTGAEDIRVVNDYWFRSWKGAKLTYRLRARDGRVIKDLTRSFDLPPDSTVSVMNREEAGDVWQIPGGFVADLTVQNAKGNLLSENHYDFTGMDVETFITSVYPLPPVAPVDSVVLRTDEAREVHNLIPKSSPGETYSSTLLETAPAQGTPHFEFTVEVPEAGEYLIRTASNSGTRVRQFQLSVDGSAAHLEQYDGLDANQPITRTRYSKLELAWYPGWRAQLSKGQHRLVFNWPGGKPTEQVIVDAVALQRSSRTGEATVTTESLSLNSTPSSR